MCMNAFVFVCACTCVWWGLCVGVSNVYVCMTVCMDQWACADTHVCVRMSDVSTGVCMECAMIMRARMNECGRWRATLYVCMPVTVWFGCMYMPACMGAVGIIVCVCMRCMFVCL